MILSESINLTIPLVIILMVVSVQNDAVSSMSTPYNDSIERYRNLMLMNGPAYIYNENRDKRQILQENNMKKDETLLITCYLALLTIFGVSMNGYAIYRTTKAKRTRCNLTIRYLAVIEFLRSSLALPNDIFKTVWHADIKDGIFGRSFLFPSGVFLHSSLVQEIEKTGKDGGHTPPCRAEANKKWIARLSSFYSLVLLSTIRYKLEVEFETKWTSITHESLFSKRHILVGGTAFIIAVPPTFGIGQYDDSGVFCTPDWAAQDATCIFYNWVLLSFGFLLPTVTWILNDFRTLKVINKWKPDGRKRNAIKREIYVMFASFYVVWIAYVSVAVLILVGYQVPEHTQLASALLTKFGVIINPVIFVFRNKDIMGRKQTQIKEQARIRTSL